MSEIPTSNVVTVNISTTPTGASRKAFSILLAITNEEGVIDTVEGAVAVTSKEAVLALGYTVDSEAYKMANYYFAQDPAPDELLLGTNYLTAQAALLKTSSLNESDFNVYKAIGDGEFNIAIDGVANDITAMDFSAVTDMIDVAAIIQTRVQFIASGGFTLATVVWDVTRFIFTSGTTGAASSFGYIIPPVAPAGTDISGLLKGGQGEATKSVGLDAETITETLNRLFVQNSSWYAFAVQSTLRDGQPAEDASAWVQSKIREFWNCSNNEDCYDPAVSNDIMSTLQALSASRTLSIFHDAPEQYPEVSGFARAATVNFGQENSTITMKFKTLPLITAATLSETQLNSIIAKGGNAYVDIGGVPMLTPGQMQVVNVWQDTQHGVDWLQNAIETNIFNYIVSKGKVPYTDAGVDSLIQQVVLALEEGVLNGLVARSGTTTDGIFLSKGYTVTAGRVKDQTQADKAARISPPISFIAIGAGAIHEVQVNGIFEG